MPGLPHTPLSIAEESAPCLEPTRIGYRSFDRQWIIPDKRVINRPNPTLWRAWSDQQVHLTALHRTAPSSGPAVTSTALIPDLDHYHGRGGRAYPLWLDADATEPNIVPGLTHLLSTQFDREVVAEDVFAYLAALLAHPGYVELFRDDLAIPGLRVPLTANDELFAQAVTVGRRVLWLHTFGQRYIDADASPPRPGGPPQAEPAPKMVEPVGPELPEEMTYDPQAQQLRIGPGLIEPVAPAVWNYEVSGVNVLTKWFSYRRADRDRPVIGARRESPLLRIQSDKWLASYTTELLEILNVLTLLVELEPQQAQLLAAIVEGPQISTDALTDRGILPVAKAARKPVKLASTDQQALDL